jgi:hypothetical protein
LTGTLKPFLGEGKRAGAVYSFILDVDDDFFLSFLGLGLFVLVCGVGVIFKSVPVIRHWLKPESHPTIERIRQRGDDLKRTSTRVQEELQSPIVKTWRWTATQTYLVKSTVFSFDVSRFDELVWGCKQAVKRRDWILPFGALYEARLAFPSHSLFLPARERQVDAVLAHAVNVTPWAMHGPARQVQLLYDQKVVTEPAENSWGRVSHDIKAEIYLTAEEAAAGVRRMVTCHYLIPCPQCHQPDRESCYLCRGSGAAVIAAPYTFDVPAGAGRGSGMVLAGDGIPKTPYAEAGTLRIWFLIE